MAFALSVFHKQDIAAFKGSFLAQGGFNLYFSVQQYDKLPLWGGMKIVIVGGLHFPEHDLSCGKLLRKKADLAGLLQRKLNILKTAFSLFVSINAGNGKHRFFILWPLSHKATKVCSLCLSGKFFHRFKLPKLACPSPPG